MTEVHTFDWLGDPDAYAEDTLAAFVADLLERNPDMTPDEARQRVLDSVPELRAVIGMSTRHPYNPLVPDEPIAMPRYGDRAGDNMDKRLLAAEVLQHKKKHPGISDRRARLEVHRKHPEWKHLWR